ncbi:MAG TPA: DUF484 family protein [Burkholderiaceae bacterium]|nr:DUF484 family protein [Burkholderiaceae bacterium]
MEPDDVAAFLAEHPDFLHQRPDLLRVLEIPHLQNGQAISLVERQSLILRERVRTLEGRLAELIRHGEENDLIVDRLVRWARGLLAQPEAAQLPATLVAELKTGFSIPFAAVRLWNVREEYAALDFARPVGEDAVRLAASMVAPFCGSNVGFDAAAWMSADPSAIKSLAMLPLRVGVGTDAFGMLVLGSPDKDRFQITMGTAFLARIAELSSAALARLRRL